MKNLDELQNISTQELIGFFTGPKALRESQAAFNAARLAVASMSAVGRLKATERAEQGMKLMVVKMIAASQEQAQEYVAQTAPELMPKKLLPRPKKS